jgi:hypothetical protein
VLGRELPTAFSYPASESEFLEELKPRDLLFCPRPRPLVVRMEVLVAHDVVEARAAFERAIDLGPLLALDDLSAREQNFMLKSRPELPFEEFFAQLSDAVAHVIAIERECAAILSHAPDKQVDMLVVGVVVIDRDPLKPGAKIPLHPGHQVAYVLPQIDLLRVFGRDDERPHQFVAPCPLAGHGCHVEVIPSGIEAEASTNLTLRAIAREITRVPDPRTFAPVAAKRSLSPRSVAHRGACWPAAGARLPLRR